MTLADLLIEINAFPHQVRGCILISLIEEELRLVPNWLDLNFSRLLLQDNHGRIIQIFEEVLPNLTSQQRQRLCHELIQQLWG